MPDSYYVGLINSELISLYVDNFVNNTSHFQINDARQLPIIIPSQSELATIMRIVHKGVASKKSSNLICQKVLDEIQEEIDTKVRLLYGLR